MLGVVFFYLLGGSLYQHPGRVNSGISSLVRLRCWPESVRLPTDWSCRASEIHNVFHVSLLRRFVPSKSSIPPAVPVEANVEYEIEKLLDSKF